MEKKILVVEDDEDLLAITKMKLEQSGYIVLTAQTGREALDIVFADNPDLVLLDILLPDIDGLSVLNEIAANPVTSQTPVIILSNLADQGSFDQAKAIGHHKYEYLVKAKTDLSELAKRVKERLGGYLLFL